MALFKIEKGSSERLAAARPNTVDGYCYFTKDDGKFYIDIENGSLAEHPEYRVALNAAHADSANHATSADNADYALNADYSYKSLEADTANTAGYALMLSGPVPRVSKC